MLFQSRKSKHLTLFIIIILDLQPLLLVLQSLLIRLGAIAKMDFLPFNFHFCSKIKGKHKKFTPEGPRLFL